MDTKNILKKMSLKEKIEQLSQIMLTRDNFEEMKERIKNECIGSFILADSATAGNSELIPLSVEQINEIQKLAMDCHGIPILFGHDVIHGHKICMPVPLAMSAAFNPELVREAYECIAEECKNDGINWSFAPMLDVSRDARWGRIIESPGEDPYLGEKMAEAVVKGFQGNGDTINIAACAKHYIGYGASEGGRDYHKTEISDYSLRNYYLRAFDSAVRAGVSTVMNSFNEISGQPTASSKYLLTDVLRGELGFEGFVVSDWEAVQQLIRQGVAEDRQMASELAINAGIDMDMCDNCYVDTLEKSAAEGKVSIETINKAVERILCIKEKMGLFENPYFEKKNYSKEKHRDYARQLAKESVVMLKNENVLPLKKNSKICVMGDMAKDRRAVLGSWSLDYDINETVTIFDGIKNACDDTYYSENSLSLNTYADAVIVVLGESDKITGEANSIANIELTDEQIYTIKCAKRTKKKVIGVLAFGRPRALENVIDDFDAVLYVWHGGSQIGNAVADIIFGDYSPSGRLPVTLPRSTGQIPIYYNCPPSGRDVDGYYDTERVKTNYWDIQASPLFPFGFGLSYTSFDLGNIRVENDNTELDKIMEGESFKISVDIKNTGYMDSDEVVQLYVRDCRSSMTRPIKELKGFEKIHLKAGESKTVNFSVGKKQLGFYNATGKFVVEKGEFKIYAGENCLTQNSVSVFVR